MKIGNFDAATTPVAGRILRFRNPNKSGMNMIRKLKSGDYRLYSRKKDSKSGKRRNLGTFPSLEKAKAHERAVQFFKRH